MKTIEFPTALPESVGLAVFICPNGAGHHKRVFGALDLVLKAKPNLSVAVFCEKKVTERFMGDFEPLQRIAANENVTFVYGVVNPGMDIMAKDQTVYANRQWLTWPDRVSPYLPFLEKAVIWGDAVPILLKIWPEMIMSSSFTFGPVILEMWGGGNDELAVVAQEYAEEEEVLMKKHMPTYVTVGLLSMPFMDERATVKKVGIMADFVPLPNAPTNPLSIGVSGGLTGLAGEILQETTKILLEKAIYQVLVDKALSGAFPALTVLGNGAKDYTPLSARIIRPGAGEVTNCVTSAIPMIAISEPENMEMENNGKRLEEAGLGIQVHSPQEAVEALETILSDEWQRNYAIAHSQMSLNGLQELADEIIKRL